MRSRDAADVIVVGAGSAGAALAARLVESGASVLLLEAGADHRSADLAEGWRSPNPVAAIVDPDHTDFLWDAHLATRVAGQEPYLYWRGKGVGGSSVVNGQIAIRPPLEDFEEWVQDGCIRWGSGDLLPDLIASESDDDFGTADYHGDAGPIPVCRTPAEKWGAVDIALRDAALAAGFPWAPDVNAPSATGVSPYPMNSRAHRRITTNDAYLEPLRRQQGLQIRAGHLVDRVLFTGSRATGVLLSDGTSLYADEVILSAGATASPSILLRSGIGPAAELRALGVTVRDDLPVGQGLQDHPLATIAIRVRNSGTVGPDDRHTNCCVRYSSGDVPGGNDMMLVSLNQSVLAMASADTTVGAGAAGVFVNRVFSRGQLQLRSTDPRDQPSIALNMLSDQRDLDRMVTGIRLLADIVDHDSFQAISDGDLWQDNQPLRFALDSDDQAVENYLRASAMDAQHPTSTCRMGDPASANTVVDPDTKVLGTEALRVADASILPFCPRANTHLVTVAVGEHVARTMI